MDKKAIIEPEGWYVKDVRLTKSGRQKVEEFYVWHFCGGWAVDAGYRREDPDFDDFYVSGMGTVQDWINDIESEAVAGCAHPDLSYNNEKEELIEGVDYVIEMQSEQALELEILAQRLNELHQVFEQELNRLGW